MMEFLCGVRDFHRSLSHLLGAAEDCLGESGWSPCDNTAWGQSSAQVRKPDEWQPHEVRRCFRIEDRPQVLAFFTVLLMNRRRDREQIPLEEPLATVVWFDYGDLAVGNWHWRYARWHSHARNGGDGTWRTYEATEADRAKYADTFRRVYSMGLPLADITSEEVLKDRLLEPFVNHVEEHTKPKEESDLGNVVPGSNPTRANSKSSARPIADE